MNEISNEVKYQIINNEIALYKNTRYQQELRYRVGKRIGQTQEALKPIEDEIVKIEMAIDELEKALKELDMTH
jgi:hypothetical protein